MHGGVDNRFNNSSTAKVVFFFETNGFSTHKCAKITLLSFSGTTLPVFFTPRAAYCLQAAFHLIEKWRTLQKKTTPLQTKRPVFLLCRQKMQSTQKLTPNTTPKRGITILHNRVQNATPPLGQMYLKRVQPTQYIYRKINSTTKGMSYSQKEPSPLGWAISPKKKKRAQKTKTTGFQHGRGGVVRQSRPHRRPRWGRGRRSREEGKEQNGGKRIDNHIKNERNARHVARKT